MPKERRLILKNVDRPGYGNDLATYVKHGGYETLKKALAIQPVEVDGNSLDGPAQIREEVKKSGLRGRGGA